MYVLNLSKENFDLAKHIDFSELLDRVQFNDERCIVTIPKSDIDTFMVIISEEIDVNGLSEDQEEVTSYGRKLYQLYDEVYALKHRQE